MKINQKKRYIPLKIGGLAYFINKKPTFSTKSGFFYAKTLEGLVKPIYLLISNKNY